mgnify:CR=1 FL=1|jgi:hypothetical protein
MRLCLLLCGLTLAIAAEPSGIDLRAEMCPQKDQAGLPCKGKVTRTATSAGGHTYKCANGHTFLVRPKISVK